VNTRAKRVVHECIAHAVMHELRGLLRTHGDALRCVRFVRGAAEIVAPDGVIDDAYLTASAREIERATLDDGLVIGTYEYSDGSRIYVRDCTMLPFTADELSGLDPEDIAAAFYDVLANPHLVGTADIDEGAAQ